MNFPYAILALEQKELAVGHVGLETSRNDGEPSG
jgi:hypothetical protein